MKLDEKRLQENLRIAEEKIDKEVKLLSKQPKVFVNFNKIVSNVHATKEVIEAMLYKIRFGEARQINSPYQIGQSLPNEEMELSAMFYSCFEQPMIFYPKESYTIPKDEAKEYRKNLGTYKTTYKEGPMFFTNEEDYQRALDTKHYVEILNAVHA